MESPHRSLQDANFQATLVASTGMTEEERIEKWFYAPVEEQGEHRGFTILLLILPIYERYLRYTHNDDGGNFSLDGPLISGIMADFGVTKDQANQFWQIMRNGLSHRSTPKQTASLTGYSITDNGKPISEPEAGQLLVNPYAVRPLLLKLFRSDSAFWSHSDYPMPDEVTVVYQPPRTGETYTQTQPHIP